MTESPSPSTGSGAAPAGPASDWALLDASAGLVDTRVRRFFCATGDERREFLHGQTTARVGPLAPGEGAAALTLTAQGRPLAIFAVYESGERIWIATGAAESVATRAALSRFLVADDCDFDDDLDAGCLTLAGPAVSRVLASAGATIATGAWSVSATTLARQPVMVFSRGDLRVPCFDVLVCDTEGRPGDAGAVEAALVAAGAAHVGTVALEILRVESGTPLYGVDVDDGRLAMEARLEWAIHFAKGCYVGQEVVERAVSRGRINHELALLEVPAGTGPGTRIDGGADGDVVTSVVHSPRLGDIALAYLPKARATEGAPVTLKIGDAVAEAVVLPWPRPRVLAGRD